MSLKHFLVLGMVLLLIGCGNLPSSEKCYERDGSESPFVVDFEGVEWKTEKVTYRIFDVDVTACGILAEATVFPTLARNYKEIESPDGKKFGLSPNPPMDGVRTAEGG